MTRRLVALALLLGACGILAWTVPDVWMLSVWESGRFDHPVRVAFTTGDRLVVVDQGGRRWLVIDAGGQIERALPAGAVELAAAEAPPTDVDEVRVWQAGFDDVRFDRGVRSRTGSVALLDPWTGLVSWSRPGSPERLLASAEVNVWLRSATAIWFVLIAAAVSLTLGLSVRLALRWVLTPGSVTPKALGLFVLLLGLGAALAVPVLQEALKPEEARARRAEMTALALRIAQDPTTLVPTGYRVQRYRWVEGTLDPRPTTGVRAEYLAAARQKRPVAFAQPSLAVVVVPAPDGLVEVQWSIDGPQMFEPRFWVEAALWLAICFGGYGLALGVVALVRRRTKPGPPVPKTGLEEQVPGLWVTVFGPDVLAPLTGGGPVNRRVWVVDWTGAPDPTWVEGLRQRQALEVPASPGFRRVILADRRPATRAWLAAAAPPGAAVGEAFVSVGFVDTGFRFEPLVTGLPPSPFVANPLPTH